MIAPLVVSFKKRERQSLGSAAAVSAAVYVVLMQFLKSNVSDLPKENVERRRVLRFKVLLWVW